MLHRLVGDGKLCQVVANHLWLHAKTNKSGPEPKKQELEKQVHVLPKNKEQTTLPKILHVPQQQNTYREIVIFYNLMTS
jgi:hypothetical protein